MSIQHRNYLAD